MSEKQETEVTEDDAFNAEMSRLNGVDVEESPSQEEVETVEATAEPEVTEEAETEEPEEKQDPQEPEEKPDEFVKQIDELRQQNEKLQRALDKTNGTYGSQLANLQQQIQSLTQQRQEKAGEVQKQITPAKLNKLREGGFTELADLLEGDLETAIVAPEMPDIDGIKSDFQKQLDAERQAREEEIKRRELRLLSREHPDYVDVAGFDVNANGLIEWNNPAFGAWLSTQSREVQNEVIDGGDAYLISDHITEYKKTLNQQPQKKPNNLKKAVQPKGVPAGRTSVLDDEDQAFRDEIRRLSKAT